MRRFYARSASDKTDNWPFWFVADEKRRYFCALVWSEIRVMCKWVRYWQHDPYWHEFTRGIVRSQVETLKMCREIGK
jgi:hypothetical protein